MKGKILEIKEILIYHSQQTKPTAQSCLTEPLKFVDKLSRIRYFGNNMTELNQIFLTSGLTIIGGIVVFSFSQIIQKFFIEPIHEQYKIVGKIGYSLLYHAKVITRQDNTQLIYGTDKDLENAQEELKDLSLELIMSANKIKFYKFFAIPGIVIRKKDLDNAISKLQELSSNMDIRNGDENKKLGGDIMRLLKLKK